MVFFNFARLLRTLFWQNTSGWLLLVFICKLWEVFQNTYFQNIEHRFTHKIQNSNQPVYTVKNYFAGAFRAFCAWTRSSHSKALIYLNFMKIVCEEVNS